MKIAAAIVVMASIVGLLIRLMSQTERDGEPVQRKRAA
jgi:hypothetical protein